ncbi:MAG TPA: helix-turn-helix transcriptional regulator [Steroidobacteraceae bacterium]
MLTRKAVVTVLRASRNEAELTQRELVDRLPKWLGFKQTTLAKIEKGRRRVDVAEFIEIAKALKLDPKTLLGRVLSWK